MRHDLIGRAPAAAAPTAEVPIVERRSATQRLRERARSIAGDLGEGGRRIAVLLAACIAALELLGAVHAVTEQLGAFDLDGEIHFEPLSEAIQLPAIFSGLLLFAASGLAALVARRSHQRRWAVLAVLFAFMGIDELAGIHESLGDSLGITWVVPYAPLGVAAGIVWLLALERMWQFVPERGLWVGAALAWVSTQVLEVAWVGGGADSPLTTKLYLLEEPLEMIGSSMFLLALYLLAGRLAAEDRATPP